ncbi:MAG: endonuclease/exonuclease/phosphatase family protein [Spirochaetes bacterium]|nr:endonuclease/exonuclease/phosphatase family protein [Spirochaetota bacterium]
MKKLKWLGIILTGVFLTLLVVIYGTTFHPAPMQSETFVSLPATPLLKPGQKIRILSWNIQYMAGKNYVFFYDLLKGDGPDERPSPKDITATRAEIARVIIDEKPDIILLQELDQGSMRTDYEDQVAKLLALLPREYSAYTSTFYHKAAFVPHPRIRGRVGLKLAVISKYMISKAVRHQLPIIPDNIIVKQFNFKRCVLETRIPVEGQNDLAVFNTHFDAFAQGSDTMDRQVLFVLGLLDRAAKDASGWLMGGDFNLLPPGKSYDRLPPEQRAYFNRESELAPLFAKYRSIPSLDEINGPDYHKWLSHYPNDPSVKGPDRTIDFIFYPASLEVKEHYIRQKDTLRISDHLPLVAEIIVPKAQ